MASGLVDNLDDGPDTTSIRRQEFEEWVSATDESRSVANKCRDYKDGKQWDPEDAAVVRRRRQPLLTDNKIQDKVNALLGLERQMRADPKAFPREQGDEESAEAATDALRYIADASTFADTAQAACDNLIVEGVCAGEVIVEKKRGSRVKISMNHIRFDRVYWDPKSLKNDFSDARYKGFSVWMDEEQVKTDWPGKLEEVDGSKDDPGLDDAQEDKPSNLQYFASVKGRNRLQIFTTYYREKDKWMRAVWCRGGYLEGPKQSNYKDYSDDERGVPACPIEIQALFRNRNGEPYGLVQRYLDTQDAINKRKSKIQHLLNTKQVKYEKGAVENVARFREELHKPDGMMEHIPGMELEIITNLDLAATQFQVLQEDLRSMSMTGPNEAMVGNTGSVSGRAKQIDQQAGQLTIDPLFGALKAWKLRMYTQAWCRVRQYWRSDMWIRVTNDEKKLKFVPLNQPMTEGDVFAEKLKTDPRTPEEKAQILQQVASDPMAQQPAMDENGKQRIKNNVGEMNVDLVLDESPDTPTVQQEQFEILASLADRRPDIPTALLIEASQLRNKKQLLDQMSGANDPNMQAMQKIQQRMADLEAGLKEAQIAKLHSEIDKNATTAQETHVDSVVKMATFTNGPEPEKGTVSVN